MLLFGFGLADRLRVAVPLALLVAYPISGYFRWGMFLGMAAVSLAVAALLASAKHPEPGWRDWSALAILGISVDLGFFKSAFPVGGLSGLSKLLFVDVGLYGYLVLRPDRRYRLRFPPPAARLQSRSARVPLSTPQSRSRWASLWRFLHFHQTRATPRWFAGGGSSRCSSSRSRKSSSFAACAQHDGAPLRNPRRRSSRDRSCSDWLTSTSERRISTGAT